MTLAIILLIAIAIMLLGAAVGKPLGWIALGFAVLVVILALFGGPLGIR